MSSETQALNEQHQPAPDGEHHGDSSLRVVGIGASAGGLKALRDFFSHAPDNSGMVFVVILHLSAEHDSNLAAVLQSCTRMPVAQVQAPTPVMPNHVYVISPTKDLSMTDGMLRVAEPERPFGRRVQIDLFFRALAATHGRNAAAVILSGTGSDGTSGLKRVKELGGVTLVQSLQEAEYDGMPRNAVATGLVDYVLPVAELPAQLVSYWNNADRIRLQTNERAHSGQEIEDSLAEIFRLMRVRTGHDFANYKRATMLRRIARRMQVHGVLNLKSYVVILREQAGEVQALLRDLLISVTNFFRDHEAFVALEKLLPGLFADKSIGDQLRVWVAGCATGEEAYSIAILLREHAAKLAYVPEILVFATDIDDDAIVAAREGFFLDSIEADVSPERLQQFFSKEQGGYRIKKEIRDLVLFASHNLLRDPPFSRLDIVSCRNLLIYLERNVQQQVLQMFHYVLRPAGLLLLGSSEFSDTAPQSFAVLDKSQRIFMPLHVTRIAPALPPSVPLSGVVHDRPGEIARPAAQAGMSFGDLHQKLLEAYAPPSVIVNESYEIVHLSERAGRFIQLAGGEPSYNLLKVVRPELRIELRTALSRAIQKGQGSEVAQVPVQIDGQLQLVNLIVRPAIDSEAARGFLLVIFDESGEAAQGARIAEPAEPLARQLDDELQRTKDQLRITIDQYEAITTELRISNEEFQAMNEELRSATEELETGKEELQSVNEELVTVNQELKTNVEELSRVNSDLQNFLIATDIATIFVDRALQIVRYTPRSQELFNLIPSDVKRPLAHVTHQLNYGQMAGDARKVLEDLVPIEREVQRDDGRWYIARLLPYRTADDRIDGVVLTFIDITERKRETAALLASFKQTDLILESISDAYYAIDSSYRCIYINQAAERLFGLLRENVLNKDIRDIFAGRENAVLLAHFQRVMEQRIMAEFEEYYPYQNVWVEARIIPTAEGGITVYQRDISRRKQIEQRLRVSEERLLLLNENIQDYAIIMLDPAGRVLDWNIGAERLFGYTSDEMIGRDAAVIFTPEDIANGVPETELQTALAEGRALDERWHMRKDGTRLWLSGVMTTLRDEANAVRGFAKVARDRTERVQAEEALRASEEHLRIALDSAQMGTWNWDLINRTITWSEQHFRLFGLADTSEQPTFDNFDEYIHPDDRAAARQAIEDSIARGQSFKTEYRVIWPDASVHWIASEGQVFRDLAGAPLRMTGVITDITSRKLAEGELRDLHDALEERIAERTEELEHANAALQIEVAERTRSERARKALLRQLVTAEEDERKRISRELHDQMGQQVTALLLGLRALKDVSRGRVATRQILDQMQELVDNLGREVHQLALQLRPPSLDDLGLQAALANEAQEWSQRTNTAIAFHSSGLDQSRLPPLIETALYRVVLEALTNALKHAQAQQISIILERRDNHVVAIVEDDGQGFESDAVMLTPYQDHGLGLLGMQERVAQVGGTLTIESAPGSGTTVFIRVPLNEAGEEGSNE